jgi:hypothetical protein
MSKSRDAGKELHALMAAVAESAMVASDETILAEAHEDGVDVPAEADRIRGLLLGAVQRTKKQAIPSKAKAQRTSLVPLVFKRLKAAGLDRAFVESRLFPSADIESLRDDELHGWLDVVVNRVFGWTLGVLLDEEQAIPVPAAPGARFKMPANAEALKAAAFAAYARYLARLVLQASDATQRPLPSDARAVRNAIVHMHGGLSLRSCLAFAWSHGVPVLPLKESGGFHGATWRMHGRNVIVLKQNTSSEARWMTDLLHELRHAAERPELMELETLDSDVLSVERRKSPEEQEATEFSGDVVLEGQAELLARECVAEAKGNTRFLKNAVEGVARRHHVRVDVLANYMAYRLALQGQNWWGAATNLQPTNEGPWQVTRDFLVQRIDPSRLDDSDRRLLLRALERE